MHTVKLTREDTVTLLEALAASQEIKEGKLKNPESLKKMQTQYLDAAHKIMEPIEIKNSQKNLMAWYIDQMRHSGRLWDTELCVRACAIARHVIDNTYDTYKSIQHYNDLFRVQPKL